ncbi:MAG: hypothetical protein PHV16_03415 [Candidatus Nanoarchaeia archaeon]|nr:hypothetical protein [Candidatus Nanoarchaeia archaeon]
MKNKDKEIKKEDNEIPDELPSLAEDTEKEKIEEQKSEQENKTQEEKLEREDDVEDIPDELQPIAEEEIGDFDEDKEKDEAELKKEQEIQEKHDIENDSGRQDEKTSGFFSNLLNITKSQGVKKNLLEKNLYKGMKEYHSLSNADELKEVSKKQLNDKLEKKLNELKFLEDDWKKQKQTIEENKKKLAENEEKIKEKVEQLKPLIKKLKFFEDVPVGKYFMSYDGVIAKNVLGLLNVLKVMDDSIFKKHVNKNKNDFAMWILKVVGDKELSEEARKAKSRKEMIFALEKVYLGN